MWMESRAGERDNVLVHLVHTRVSHISGESGHADFTATEKGSEKLIQMSEQHGIIAVSTKAI